METGREPQTAWRNRGMPGLRNLERRLLRVERQLAPPAAETEIPVTLLRETLDQMDQSDRQCLSELKGLNREQIRRRIADDHKIRVCGRRAIGFALTPEGNDLSGFLAKRRRGDI
jgi:hypothetical protein